jgi:hypothetical protein
MLRNELPEDEIDWARRVQSNAKKVWLYVRGRSARAPLRHTKRELFLLSICKDVTEDMLLREKKQQNECSRNFNSIQTLFFDDIHPIFYRHCPNTPALKNLACKRRLTK